jgi:carbamoyl-phosphate synthase small subunit
MLKHTAILALSDGRVIRGQSVGAEGDAVGEFVFNTAMTGYQEMLSDPSYAQQILMLTTPHVGNTGCHQDDMESSRAWATGLVVRECSASVPHFRAQWGFSDWLKKNNIVAISGVDTRALTLSLRETGAISACVSTYVAHPEEAIKKAKAFRGLSNLNLADEVSRQTTVSWDGGLGEWSSSPQPMAYHVVVYDFGVKHQILKILQDRGCHVTLVPSTTPAKDVLAMAPHGVLLSNGPGDPAACHFAIEQTKVLLSSNIPLFGICLGFQILALATGAKAIKMKFGHHGVNHPVAELFGEKRVFVTSQNHGFMIDETTLSPDWKVTHRSLFDQSLQGIAHIHQPVLGFQGHPEASPGPHDMGIIFDTFIDTLKKGS